MNKTELLALCQSLGLSATNDMTIDELKALIASFTTTKPPVATQQSASATSSAPKSADTIFRQMNADNVATFTCKLMFTAPARNDKCRLIVKRNGKLESVYTFKDVVTMSGVQNGCELSILAERKPASEGKEEWWNAIAIAVAE